MTVKTRFAPSPTGFLHVGGARTALFSYLYARRHQGDFLLRIEDTDRERSSEKTAVAILDDLEWLGLRHDLAPFYQSEREQRYQAAAEYLLDAGLAYRCDCTREELSRVRGLQQARGEKPRYGGRCRERNIPPARGVENTPPAVRFKTPREGSVVFDDLVHGRMEISNSELDDLVLLRADGSATYHLAVVVDDADMGITDVIRGDDHLNNTPRQMHIFRALGFEAPRYAHLPMILNQDGSRMSKRGDAVSISQYRREGYLPQAVLNYLVRLGWSCKDQEIFSLEEMSERFALDAVNRSAASLNPEKLRWLNRHYLKELPVRQLLPLFEERLLARGFNSDAVSLQPVFEALRTRYRTLQEMVEGAAFIYGDQAEVFDTVKASRVFGLQTKPWLENLLERLKQTDPWTEDLIRQAMDATCADAGVGISRLGPPLRFAITYGAASPELPKTLMLVGRARCVERLNNALEWIDEHGSGAG